MTNPKNIMLSKELRKHVKHIKNDQQHFDLLATDIVDQKFHKYVSNEEKRDKARNEKKILSKFIENKRSLNSNSYDYLVQAINNFYKAEIIQVLEVENMNNWRDIFLHVTGDRVIPLKYNFNFENNEDRVLLSTFKTLFTHLIKMCDDDSKETFSHNLLIMKSTYIDLPLKYAKRLSKK